MEAYVFAKSTSERSGVYRQAGEGYVRLREGRRIVIVLQDKWVYLVETGWIDRFLTLWVGLYFSVGRQDPPRSFLSGPPWSSAGVLEWALTLPVRRIICEHARYSVWSEKSKLLLATTSNRSCTSTGQAKIQELGCVELDEEFSFLQVVTAP